MTNFNRVWHTRKDQVSPFSFKLTKEKMAKDYEKDQNMAKIKTHLNIFQNNVMGAGAWVLTVVGDGCPHLNEYQF